MSVSYFNTPGEVPSGFATGMVGPGPHVIPVRCPQLTAASVVQASVVVQRTPPLAVTRIDSFRASSQAGGSMIVTFSNPVDATTKIAFGPPSISAPTYLDVPTVLTAVPAPTIIAVFNEYIVIETKNALNLALSTTVYLRKQGALVAKAEFAPNTLVNNSSTNTTYIKVPIKMLDGVSVSMSSGTGAESPIDTDGGFPVLVYQSLSQAYVLAGSTLVLHIDSTVKSAPTITTSAAVGQIDIEVTDIQIAEWPTSINFTFVEQGTSGPVLTQTQPLNFANNLNGVAGQALFTFSEPTLNLKPNTKYNITAFTSNAYFPPQASFAVPGQPPLQPNLVTFFNAPTPPVGPFYPPLAGDGSNQSPRGFTTGSYAPPLPSSPASVTASNITFTTATVTFPKSVTNPTSPFQIDYYQVSLYPTQTTPTGTPIVTEVPWTSAATFSADLVGLAPGSPNYVEVVAANNFGNFSATPAATTITASVALAPVTNLVGVPNGSYVTLTWLAPVPQASPTITNYIVQRTDPDGSISEYSAKGTDSAGNPFTQLEFVDVNLLENQSYTYRVFSRNALYTSAPVSVVVAIPATTLPIISDIVLSKKPNTLWTITGFTAPAAPGPFATEFQLLTVSNPITGARTATRIPWYASSAPITTGPAPPAAVVPPVLDVSSFITTGTWNVTLTTVIETIIGVPISLESEPWVVEYAPEEPDLAPAINVAVSYLPSVPDYFPTITDFASVVVTWNAPTTPPSPPIQRYTIFPGDPKLPQTPLAVVNGLDTNGQPIQSLSWTDYNLLNVTNTSPLSYSVYIVANNEAFNSPPSQIATKEIPATWGGAGVLLTAITGTTTNIWSFNGLFSNSANPNVIAVPVLNIYSTPNFSLAPAKKSATIAPVVQGGPWGPITVDVTTLPPGRYYVVPVTGFGGPVRGPAYIIDRV